MQATATTEVLKPNPFGQLAGVLHHVLKLLGAQSVPVPAWRRRIEGIGVTRRERISLQHEDQFLSREDVPVPAGSLKAPQISVHAAKLARARDWSLSLRIGDPTIANSPEVVVDRPRWNVVACHGASDLGAAGAVEHQLFNTRKAAFQFGPAALTSARRDILCNDARQPAHDRTARSWR